MVSGFGFGKVRHRLAVRVARDVLESSSHPKIVIAVEEVAEVRKTISTPTASGCARVTTVCIAGTRGGSRLGVVEVRSAATRRNLNFVERLRYVDAAA